MASAGIINGLGGDDRMDGGNGSDTCVIEDAGDRVNEQSSNSTDTIRSSISLNLSDTTKVKGSVENLTLREPVTPRRSATH